MKLSVNWNTFILVPLLLYRLSLLCLGCGRFSNFVLNGIRTCSAWIGCYLTADHLDEVGLLRWEDVKLGFVGSLPVIFSHDLQSESVIIPDVDLLTVTAANQKTAKRCIQRAGTREMLRGDMLSSESFLTPRITPVIVEWKLWWHFLPFYWQGEVRFANVVISTVQQDMSLIKARNNKKWRNK